MSEVSLPSTSSTSSDINYEKQIVKAILSASIIPNMSAEAGVKSLARVCLSLSVYDIDAFYKAV